MKNTPIYEDHLTRVSRSFAFCIEKLTSPLKDWVGLAYILCRLVDTVEDALWADLERQKLAFKEFESFIENPLQSDKICAWIESFPDSISEGEKLLLADSGKFFEDLHSLDDKIKTPLKRTVLDMGRGMSFFSGEEKGIRLNSLIEVNQYCFYVAGIIGELLTELFAASEPGFECDEKMLVNAYHFGLYLQKINLLKDQITDEPEGRFLVPSRPEMEASLVANSKGALEYILNLPMNRSDYRVFCAWSLYLGLASLPFIRDTWAKKKLQKIPRTKTVMLLGKVEGLIDDNEELKDLFNEMFILKGVAPMPSKGTLPAKDKIWLYKYYQGKLTPKQMRSLMLI